MRPRMENLTVRVPASTKQELVNAALEQGIELADYLRPLLDAIAASRPTVTTTVSLTPNPWSA